MYVMSIVLALSSNIDTIGVGISYGTRRITIPLASNCLIAFITSSGTLLSLILGHYICDFLEPHIAVYLGSTAIMGMGILIVIQDTIKRSSKKNDRMLPDNKSEFAEKSFLQKILIIHNNPLQADMDYSSDISIKESVYLGCALTLNNLANGVGAGMIKLNPIVTTTIVFLFSMITLRLGTSIGQNYMCSRLGIFSGSASGLLLIGMGIYGLYS